jgi:hypothetical protein
LDNRAALCTKRTKDSNELRGRHDSKLIGCKVKLQGMIVFICELKI